MDIWINQIKQWIADVYAKEAMRLSATPALLLVGHDQGHTISCFLSDTFTKQASGFFHIDSESIHTSNKKVDFSRKKHNPGKILIFPFVFLLIFLDELGKVFRTGKQTLKTPEEPAENRYNPK